jgi:hypothetical protein
MKKRKTKERGKGIGGEKHGPAFECCASHLIADSSQNYKEKKLATIFDFTIAKKEKKLNRQTNPNTADKTPAVPEQQTQKGRTWI